MAEEWRGSEADTYQTVNEIRNESEVVRIHGMRSRREKEEGNSSVYDGNRPKDGFCAMMLR